MSIHSSGTRRARAIASVLIPLAVLGLGVMPAVCSEPSRSLQPLRVSENYRFLVKADGAPFFWLGDTAWAILQKCSREDAPNQPSVLKYFRSRADKGFNVIQCRLVHDAESADGDPGTDSRRTDRRGG